MDGFHSRAFALVACTMALSVAFADAGSAENVRFHMDRLQAQINATVPLAAEPLHSERRSGHVYEAAPTEFVNDVSQLDTNARYRICPAHWYNGHCLHVGLKRNVWIGDYGTDVRVWQEPDDLTRFALKRYTYERSIWQIIPGDYGGVHRFISPTGRWAGKPLFIPTYDRFAGVGWGYDLGYEHNNNDWQIQAAEWRDGITYWRIRLGINEKNWWQNLQVWSGTGVGMQEQKYCDDSCAWTIEKIPQRVPSPPTQAGLDDFVPGRLFRIYPSNRHPDHSLHTDASKGIAMYPNPKEEEEFRIWPGSLFYIYRDYDDHFVIESALLPGHLLHTEDSYQKWLSFHPTKPNPGSRWRLRPTNLGNLEAFFIQPSQRHTGNYLHSGYDLDNVKLSWEHFHWSIQEYHEEFQD